MHGAKTLRLCLVCFGEGIHAVGLEVIRYLLAVHYAKLNEQGRTEIITQAGNTLRPPYSCKPTSSEFCRLNLCVDVKGTRAVQRSGV